MAAAGCRRPKPPTVARQRSYHFRQPRKKRRGSPRFWGKTRRSWEGRYMKSFLKWGLIAFVGLAVLGALFGKDEKAGQTKADSATTSTSEPTPTETSTPEATPDAEVSVNYTGPSSVHSDYVV